MDFGFDEGQSTVSQQLLFFEGALQGVARLAGRIHDLRHFGFCHFKGINPAYAHAFLMHMQHDGVGVLAILREELLKNKHYKFHGRVVVVQQQHFVKRRFLRFGLGAGENARAAVVIVFGRRFCHASI